MMPLRRRLAPLLFIVIAACGKSEAPSGPAPAGNTPPPATVDVLTLRSAPAVLTDDLPGRVLALRTAQVRARVEGVLERQLFADGAAVRAGTPLYRIDPRAFDAAAKSAAAELANAGALLARYRPLRDSGAVSAHEIDAQMARVAVAEAALARARLDLENATPTAPISGRAGRSLVTEGALVGRGEATHLVTIEQIDPVRVEFTQSHADWLALRQLLAGGKATLPKDAEVELVREDGSLHPQRGRLRFSDLAVDAATGALVHRAEFPNPAGELLPGTFVRVRLPRAQLAEALTVPQRAVIAANDTQSVLLVDADNKVVPRPIVTGGMAGGHFIVAKGLAAGDRVIVNGLQKARPGSEVTPMPWQPGAPVLDPAKPAASAKP